MSLPSRVLLLPLLLGASALWGGEPAPATPPERQAAPAAEPAPVQITVFKLHDGTEINTWNYASAGEGEFKTYLLRDVDGRNLTVLGSEVASSKEERLPLAQLPEKTRRLVLQQRAAAAAIKAEAEAAAGDQQAIGAARQREKDAQAELRKATRDLETAHQVAAAAEEIIKEAPIAIARADARYDAAKAELSGLAMRRYVTYGGLVYGSDERRADALRQMMVDAAEEKAHLDADKKEAEQVVQNVQKTTKQLLERREAAQKNYEEAQAQFKEAAFLADKRAKERAQQREAKAAEEFEIRPAEKK